MNVYIAMQITSPDFINGGKIPPRFTCDGEGVSPTLEIRGVPKEAHSLALVVDDPDAPSGIFTHWVVWNIPVSTEKIVSGSLPAGAFEGLNSAGELGYIGPCPPSGTHNYIFTLYALDEVVNDLDPKTTDRNSLRDRIAKHIISEDELVGLYCRNS